MNVELHLYRFDMRTLADPVETATYEAGPFTPEQAAAFAQDESGRQCMLSGRPWVCDYGPIALAGSTQEPRRLAALSLWSLILLTGLLGLLWALIVR